MQCCGAEAHFLVGRSREPDRPFRNAKKKSLVLVISIKSVQDKYDPKKICINKKKFTSEKKHSVRSQSCMEPPILPGAGAALFCLEQEPESALGPRTSGAGSGSGASQKCGGSATLDYTMGAAERDR